MASIPRRRWSTTAASSATADPQQFVEVLAGHAVLVDPTRTKLESLWAFRADPRQVERVAPARTIG